MTMASSERVRRKPRDQWLVFLPNAHEGYVSWEQFEQIQRTISENTHGWQHVGAAHDGQALLAGLLRCRRCGHKLSVCYSGTRYNALRYVCQRGALDNGEPRCIGFGGVPVDAAISREVLRVVQPAAVEAAVMASEEVARERDEVLAALQRDLEAARYSASWAQRQYDAVDPENRLIAAELERRWNQALQRVHAIENQVAERMHDQSAVMAPPRQELEELANKLQTIWESPDVDMRLKKRIVRTLIKEIIVDVDNDACEVIVVIHWNGGVHTEVRLPRRRRGQNSSQAPKEVIEAVRELSHICSDKTIASVLNRNGLVTGRGNRWTREHVTALRTYHQVPCYSADVQGAEGWANLTQAAHMFLTFQPTHRSRMSLQLYRVAFVVISKRPIFDGLIDCFHWDDAAQGRRFETSALQQLACSFSQYAIGAEGCGASHMVDAVLH